MVCAAAREFTVDQDGRHTTYAMLSGTLGGLLALHIVNHYLVLRPSKLLTVSMVSEQTLQPALKTSILCDM